MFMSGGVDPALLFHRRLGHADQAARARIRRPGGSEVLAGRSRLADARSARDIRSRFRDIDRRLADIESYVTTENRSLAREIEQLR